MKFMLMCTFNENDWDALEETRRDAIMQAYGEWVDEQVAAGHYISGGKLDVSASAVNVRQRDGETRVTDGPFAEAREQIGGFHVVECADRDAAVAIAGTIPTLPAGGVVEVRPLLYELGAERK